jgi:hypothetical protein
MGLDRLDCVVTNEGREGMKLGKVRSRGMKNMRTMKEMMIDGGAVVVSGSADVSAMFKELYEREEDPNDVE